MGVQWYLIVLSTSLLVHLTFGISSSVTSLFLLLVFCYFVGVHYIYTVLVHY
jgi:hypothetical protein